LFSFWLYEKDDATDQDDKYETKHFDFRLNGDVDGVDRQDDIDAYEPKSRDFAYAYFRDELKAKENCNPDINIEMDNKPSNPHQTKFNDANEKALGMNGGRDNQTSHARDWNANYELDLIGREYCRDRQIPVSKAEFQTFVIWQQAKGQMIMAHYKWIKSVLTQMKFVKDVIKGYKYLDEALEFAKESGLNINDAEIIRTNNEALYNGSLDDNSVSADIVDQASSYTDKTVEMKAISRQIKLISKIDQALTRIKDGAYGFCAETGEPIGLKRLIARPVAELCIAAQEKHEKNEKIFADL